MSTDFLNRRMDLNHSLKGNTNTLTMDTSYPVKLAGKIMKIFTATSDYNKNKNWVVVNTEGKNILEVPANKVYDFAGRLIDINIGQGMAYEIAKDVFKNGDYVMAILDFDTNTMCLCSQSNFAKFIIGNGKDETFKLFDITGTEGDTDSVKVTFNQEEKLINQSAFKQAVEFDGVENFHAFVRHDSDNIVYQLPKIDESVEDVITKVSCIPVADLEINNINGLNMSCYPLLFPAIANGIMNNFETIDGYRNFAQLSGKFNDNFIKEFCYTADELKALPMLGYDEESHEFRFTHSNGYMGYFIKSIFKEQREDNYIYFIKDSTSKEDAIGFSTSAVRLSQIILPISIKTNRLSAIENIGNNKNLCNGKKMELNYLNNFGISGNLIGDVWFETYEGAWFFAYNVPSSVEGKSQRSSYALGFRDLRWYYDAYKEYASEEERANDIYNVPFKKVFTLSKFNNNFNEAKNYLAIGTRYRLVNGSKISEIRNFVNFFGNDDIDYKNYQYEFALSNNHNLGPMAYLEDYDYTASGTKEYSPVGIVAACREDLYDIMNNTTSSLKNYSKTLSESEKRELTYFSQAYDSFEPFSLFFKLLMFSQDEINNDENKLNYMVKQAGGDETTFRENNGKKFRFKAFNDFIPSSANCSTNLIRDKRGKFHTTYFLSKLVTRCVDFGYGENKDNLITDIGGTKLLITSKEDINFVKPKSNYDANAPYITIADDANKSLILNKGGNRFELYMVNINDAGNRYEVATYNNLSNELSYNKSAFLYYTDNDVIFRTRLFVDASTFEDRWNKVSSSEVTTNNVFTDFDYFLCPVAVVRTSINENNDNLLPYDKAFCICEGINKSNVKNSLPQTRIITVTKKYFLYKDTIKNNLNEEGIPVFAGYIDINKQGLGDWGTLNLLYSLDYIEFFYRRHQDKTIYDIVPDDTYFYQGEGPAPKLSRKLDNGSFIYNLDTYKDFISNVYIAQYTNDVVSNITSVTGSILSPVLNPVQLKYMNSKGVREEYYQDKTIYEFFTYLSLYDLAIPSNEQNIDTKIEASYPVYKKGTFDRVTGKIKKSDSDTTEYYVDTNNNFITVECGIALMNSVNNNNRFGFNESYIINDKSEICTYRYVSDEKIFATSEKAGNKSALNISLSDKDNVLLNINGILGDIQVDKITWNDLLVALSNNKTIDVLSDSLSDIKNELNKKFLITAQNISDTISIEDNIKPASDIASFSEETNLYSYLPFKGYNEDNIREDNNRGVIVFVTEGGSYLIDRHGSDKESSWTEDKTESKIRPKRMFISKDGIICTKDYYDVENNPGGSGSDIITFNKIINIINEMQNQYDEDVSEMSQYLFNKSKKQIEFNKLKKDGRELFVYMLSDEDDNHVIYKNTITYKVVESDGKLIINDAIGRERRFIANGIALINGVPYVFNENGYLRCGAVDIDTSDELRVGGIPISSKSYYYSYEDGNIVHGWIEGTIVGNYYYYTLFDGKLTSQYRTLGSYDDVNIEKTYWFDENGVATETEVKGDLLDSVKDLEEQIIDLQNQINELKINTGGMYSNLLNTVYAFNGWGVNLLRLKGLDQPTYRELNTALRDKTEHELSKVADAINHYNESFLNEIWEATLIGNEDIEKEINETFDNCMTYNDKILEVKSATDPDLEKKNGELVKKIKEFNTNLIGYFYLAGWIDDRKNMDNSNAKISM